VELVIEMQNLSKADKLPPETDFKRWIEATLHDRKQSAEIVVRLVDEQESADLNQTYRGKAGPTNVLSFPFEAPAQLDMDLLGDLVICAPVIEREAIEQHKTAESHWAHMAVHGTLHLLGYDHQTDEQAVEMELLEKEILTGMGYQAPYSDEE
jgi:probable rRNA maturation factor